MQASEQAATTLAEVMETAGHTPGPMETNALDPEWGYRECQVCGKRVYAPVSGHWTEQISLPRCPGQRQESQRFSGTAAADTMLVQTCVYSRDDAEYSHEYEQPLATVLAEQATGAELYLDCLACRVELTGPDANRYRIEWLDPPCYLPAHYRIVEVATDAMLVQTCKQYEHDYTEPLAALLAEQASGVRLGLGCSACRVELTGPGAGRYRIEWFDPPRYFPFPVNYRIVEVAADAS